MTVPRSRASCTDRLPRRVGELVTTGVEGVDLSENVLCLLADRTKTCRRRSVVISGRFYPPSLPFPSLPPSERFTISVTSFLAGGCI